VPENTTSVNVTARLSDTINGSIKINGISSISGTAKPVTLSGDVTVITITTAAGNGDTMSYKVTVNKAVKAPVSASTFILSLPDEAIEGFPAASKKIYQRGYENGPYADDLPRTFTVTVAAGLTVHQWYVDGIPKEAEDHITIKINARDYAFGDHSLSRLV
jgi:hypothetical protein